MFVHCGWVFFTNCSPLGLDTTQSIGIMCKLFLDVITFSVSFITKGQIDSFLWAWVGPVVNGQLEYNHYIEEVRKGWKEARCNGIWSVEVNLSIRMIEEKGWRWWKLGCQ